jgi:hypothetical protein
MNRFVAWLVMTLALAAPQRAHADEAEIQPILMPVFTLLPRHNHLNHGFGSALMGRWGWRDAVAFEAVVLVDRFESLKNPSYMDDGTTGTVYYDATRCLIAPGVALRHGARLVTSVSVDLGYRFEVQSNRDFVAPTKILIGKFDQRTRHALVVRAAASLEYRILEWLSAGGQFAATSPLLGDPAGVDYTFGLLGSVYFYP